MIYTSVLHMIYYPKFKEEFPLTISNQHMKKDFDPCCTTPAECDSVPVTPTTISGVIARVPVVLAEARVITSVSTVIHFPSPVLEIKRIKKNVKLVQCHLLPGTNRLFLEGFVRKNIQFATPTFHTSTRVNSDLRSLTVDVPFSCTTTLTFLTPPATLIPGTTEEFDFFAALPLPFGFPTKESLLTKDFSQFAQISNEFLNSFPFCELVSSRIVETDEALDRQPIRKGPFGCINCENGPIEEGTFTKVREKMQVEFTIKVLQNRQVTIP